MDWDSIELSKAASIVLSLAKYSTTGSDLRVRKRLLTFSSADAIALLDGIRVTHRVNRVNFVPIRHVYRLLDFDENHSFHWRLEHKLIQALLLNHFCPGCVPVTLGLSTYALTNVPRFNSEVLFREQLARNFVKRALGSGAHPNNEEETERATLAVLSGHSPPTQTLDEEQWIVQERLSVAQEYRVHTIEGSVVPDLTYLRHANRTIRGERTEPNEYVSSILATLPSAFVANSLCGWDICRTTAGRYLVVEMNFGGFHPVTERGFQCSGFFAQETWGPFLVARLLRFIESKYGVTIRHETVRIEAVELFLLYQWIARWHNLLRTVDLVKQLTDSVHLGDPSAELPGAQVGYLAAHGVFMDVLQGLRKVTEPFE